MRDTQPQAGMSLAWQPARSQSWHALCLHVYLLLTLTWHETCLHVYLLLTLAAR